MRLEIVPDDQAAPRSQGLCFPSFGLTFCLGVCSLVRSCLPVRPPSGCRTRSGASKQTPTDIGHGSCPERGGPPDSGHLPACWDGLEVSLEPAAFPSVEILALIPNVDKTICAAFLRYRGQNPISGERHCFGWMLPRPRGSFTFQLDEALRPG